MAEHSVSGLDPSISLHVRGGDKGTMDAGYMPSANALNPMGQVSDILGVVQKMNEVKQFNSAFSARQKAGRILADAPTLEDGVKTLAQDPETSVFAPEAGANAMATRQALLTAGGTIQSQGQDAMQNFLKGFGAVLQDPAQYDVLTKNSLELASPAIRGKLEKAFGNLKNGLLDGLDADPEKAKGQLVQRISGYMTAAGAGATIPQIMGAQGQVDTGEKVQPGTIAPMQGRPNWLGGGAAGTFTPAGNALFKGLPPQQGNVGAPLIGGKYGAGAIPPQSPAGPGAAPELAPENGINYSTQAADGKPLFDKSVDMTSPVISRGTGAGGGNVMSPDQAAQSHALSDRFNKEDYNSYQGAVKSVGMLDEMGRNFDQLAKIDPGQKSNFMTPGAGGELRLSLAKGANMVSGVLGGDVVFDPSKIAAGEDLMKVTQRLGPSVLQSLLGQQREAAETILNMNEKGVPNINNTYLGGKLMISAIKQATQREIDLRNWKETWLANPKNQGSLIGADDKFNKLHPASGYIDKALDEYGLTASGFKDLPALEAAVKKGLMTPKQAADQAKLQGFKLGK